MKRIETHTVWSHQICEAFPQNREQVIFWVKWDFDAIVIRSTLSALTWYQNQVHTLTFWDMTIWAWYLRQFLWKCNFEKSAFEVPYSYSFVFDRLQKNTEFFVRKCLKISQKLQEGDRRLMKICRKLSEKLTDESFSPLCQLQLPISQNKPVRLVPCFVGAHHIYIVDFWVFKIINLFWNQWD